MKRKIWLNHLLGAVFAFALSVSAVGCLATGFDLTVESMGGLIFRCGLFAALCALLLRFKYGGTMLLCLTALAAGFLWRQGILLEQLQTLVLDISTRYHRAYDWPTFGANAAGPVDYPLAVIGWWTAVSVGYHVCRRSHILTVLPSVVLPLVLCLVVTDTVPDEIYLYFLILGVALLLLTDWVRQHNPAQACSLTLRMAAPVAAALALLFLLAPQKSYVNRAREIQKEVVDWFQQLQSFSQEVTEDIWSNSGSDASGGQRVNLRTVGPKSQWSYAVMRVTSPVDGVLYLRGQDYNTYSGSGWVASRHRSEVFTPGGDVVGQLTIETYSTRNVLYVPYYVSEAVQLYGGSVSNEESLTTYSYDLALAPGAAGAVSTDPGADLNTTVLVPQPLGTEPPDSQYLQLPVDTMRWANILAREITAGCETRAEMVEAIGDHVRSSAAYDLATSRMSTDAEDFAQWFLTESDTGYCVHFATAATVLLRAAGIPARYVEGYMVPCTAGEATVVSNQRAHAWVEYYEASAWRVLEATPPDESREEETEAALPTDAAGMEPDEPRESTTPPTGESETQPMTAPGMTEASGQQERNLTIPGWLKMLLWMALAVLGVVLQSQLRIIRKRRRWNRGTPNEKALARWQQTERLSRLLKIPVPGELEGLAQKAKFSNHTLTREELQAFERFRREALAAAGAMPWYRKLLLRWIFAVG